MGNYTGARSFNSSDFTYWNSLAEAAIEQYLASVEERATMYCFVQLQEIELAPRKIRKALVEVRFGLNHCKCTGHTSNKVDYKSRYHSHRD